MAFKANYRRDRAERQRAARARSEEKQRKKTKKLHSAKLNAPQPNLLQMIRRRAMCRGNQLTASSTPVHEDLPRQKIPQRRYAFFQEQSLLFPRK